MPTEQTAPIGSIVAFAGPPVNLPDNWMVCDGRKLSSIDFRELHSKIGVTWGGDGVPNFYLPDLRGMFLRGVDRNQDGTEALTKHDPNRESRDGFLPPDAPLNPGNGGNAVGSFQKAATALPSNKFKTNGSGTHTHLDPTYNGVPNGPSELATDNRGYGYTDFAPPTETSAAGDHSHFVISGGDAETRPENAYVYWIIRVK